MVDNRDAPTQRTGVRNQRLRVGASTANQQMRWWSQELHESSRALSTRVENGLARGRSAERLLRGGAQWRWQRRGRGIGAEQQVRTLVHHYQGCRQAARRDATSGGQSPCGQ